MLKSRTAVFGAHYVSISTKMETKLTADSKWDLVLTQTLTLVLEDSTKKEDGTTHLSSLLGIDKKGVTIENSCVAARLSRVHAESHAPFKVAGAGENMTDFFPKREHTAMAPIGGGVNALTKMETKLTADSKWDLVLTQTLTLVLEDSTKKEDGTTHLSSLLGIDKKGVTIENSCVAARLSRVHAESHAPFKVAGAGENMTDFFPKREHTAMAPIGGGVNALIRLQTWDLSGIGRRTTGRTGSTRSTRLTTGESGVIAAPAVFDLAFSEDKESALSGESYSKAPLLGYTPELTGERYLTGSGTRDGGLTVEVTRNLGTDVDGGRKSRDTKLRLFQPMPWYVRVFIHTLRVTYDGEVVELVSGTKSKSKSSKSSTANFVEGLSWSPSIDRKRPSVLEMQLAIPKDVAAVKIAVTYEKAFLYLNEFPPDANRGFDLPPAVLTFPPPRVIRFFRNLQGMDALESPLLDLMEGLVVGGNTASEQPELVYLNGLLITMPTPDFSMPFNVITMVCTLMSLLAGGVLAALTKRPSWDDFKAQKKTQGARLKALARSSNAVAKRGKGGKGDAKEE